jgi:pyruvate,water dikinase
MTSAQIGVLPLGDSGSHDGLGSKTNRLAWLLRHRRRVPKTFVLPFAVYQACLEDPHRAWLELQNSLEQSLDPTQFYAVRSSANVEDEQHHSFAGQFQSHLDVQGIPDTLAAIRSVYDSIHADSLGPYLAGIGVERSALRIAVVIQEMITPVLSGVSFSQNPVTGLTEIVVEAVQGRGDRLVQGGVTPYRWVHAWDKWREKPEESPVPLDVIQHIVEETQRIQADFGEPVDLEWVFDGEHVYWVQLRPIFGLSEINIYSNTISREFLPGMIKPLVWSVNIPLVNSAWVRLLTELIGPNDIQPEALAKSFYYRAYFNMGVLGEIFNELGFPRESLERLLGLHTEDSRPAFRPSLRTLRHIPRMLRFLFQAWRFEIKLEEKIQEIGLNHQRLRSEDLSATTEAELLMRIDSLQRSNLETAYINILVPLLMSLYNAILRFLLARGGITSAELDLTAGMDELADYVPNAHLQNLRDLYDNLDVELQRKIRRSNFRDFPALDAKAVRDFHAGLLQFLDRFGHLSDSGNDFSHVPWRENADLVLKMVMEHSNPPEPDRKLRWEELALGWFHRRWIEPYYHRARRFQFRREQVSSLYTFGYGWYREYFMALATRFMERGLLERRGDIFYLSLDEIRSIVGEEGKTEELLDLVVTRKQEMKDCREITLPDVIYGDQVVQLPHPRHEGNELKGVPTSRGHYRGPVKVIRGLDEIDRLEDGDVLVIPYSDVAWTPLFSKAGAVVAEAGGMLSHSSIVAREYGIPCVVSVPGACLLPEGEDVIVNGYLGTVMRVHERAIQRVA